MSLHQLPGMLRPSAAATPSSASKIPHLLFALSSARAARPPRRHVSSRQIPSLPPRARPLHRPREDPTSPSRSPTVFLWAISLFGASAGLYLSYWLSSYRRASALASQLHVEQNADVSARWDDVDRDYDEEIEFSEKAMFMGRKRRRLLGGSLVEGKVLEVSCGTGRNFGWYDFERKGKGRIEELVFNDRSEVMLRRARAKWEALQAERRKTGKGVFKGVVKGAVGDAGVRGVITRPEGGFDTIVQTMGVCSMQDTAGFLREMNYLVRQPGEGRGSGDPEDKGGKILLLEHGRGHYKWINELLDQLAVSHALRYGCWYNKDVGEVVRESGLNVGNVRRYHLGTTWEVILRPNPELLRGKDRSEEVLEKQDGGSGRASASGSGSRSGSESASGSASAKRKSWWPWNEF